MKIKREYSPEEIAKIYDIRPKPGGHTVHMLDDRCVTCKYITGTKMNVRGGHYIRNPSCDYIGITGNARMCPAGRTCTKFERGNGTYDDCIIDPYLDL